MHLKESVKRGCDGKMDVLLLETIEKSSGEGVLGGLELNDIGEGCVFREKFAKLGGVDCLVEIDVLESGCSMYEYKYD